MLIERIAPSVLLLRVALVALIAAGNPTVSAAQNASASTSGLTIVVIAGEDAINVIQQKTAVAPIVEVRDRNNQPISGASVRFVIQGSRATFNGARTLTLTTNAAGRAAITGMTPTGSGVFHITASATFQGQTAAVTIAQTNVLTAAEAASVTGASGAGGSGGGAGGGGLSFTTIGIVGGAVAGGALVATQVVGGNDGVQIYEGDFRIDTILTVQQAQSNGVITLTCTASLSQVGEVRGEIEEHDDGTVTGTMSAKWSVTELSRTCPASSAVSEVSYGKATVTGTAAGFQASSQSANPDGVGFGAQAFSGTLSNGVIKGTWTLGPSGYKGANGFGGALSPAGSVAVTLTK